jgi:hypothetical protein
MSSKHPTERENQDTDRPEADARKDAMLPAADLSQDEAWNLRFDDVLKAQKEQDRKINDIYSLLMGASPSGRPHPAGQGGVGQALHDTANHLSVVAMNADLVAEAMSQLPKQVAQEVARELATPMMKLFQDEVSKLREKDAALERRIEELEGDVATLNGMLVP